MKTDNKTTWKELPRWRKNAIVFFFCCIALLLYALSTGGSDDNDSNNSSTGMNAADSARNAFIISKHYIKQTLKSPSTADFPFSDYQAYRNKETGSITITSYVDAQNSFGAEIRTYYSIELLQKDSDWSYPGSWQVLNIDVQ